MNKKDFFYSFLFMFLMFIALVIVAGTMYTIFTLKLVALENIF